MLKDKPLPTISRLIISEESRNSGNSTLPEVPRVILAQTTSFQPDLSTRPGILSARHHTLFTEGRSGRAFQESRRNMG